MATSEAPAQKSSSMSSESLVSEIIDNGTVSRQQVLVVALCMLLNILDGFDITAMAVVASSVSAELGLLPDQLGWVFSFALLGMVFGAMFLAPLSDLFGRRRTIVVSVVLVGISISLTASANTLGEFVVLRFLSGLGAGAIIACQAALAAEYSPEKYRALSVASVVAGYPLGAMLTSVAASSIMPEYGWRGMFWFGGGVTLFFGVVAWLLLPESLKYLFERRPADALDRVNKILAKLEKPLIQVMPGVANADVSPGLFQNMFRLLRRERIELTLTLWLTFFLCFATLYFLMSWIPNLMEDAGFRREVAYQAFFLFNLGGVIGIFALGAMSTRWKLTTLVSAMLICSAIAMLIFAAVPDRLDSMLISIFVIGFLQQGGFTGLYSVAAKAYPTQIRSTGIGWAVGLGRSGAVAGPAVAGYLIAAGLDMSTNFYLFAVPMAIGGAIAYRLNIR